MPRLPERIVLDQIIGRALEEDLASGDVTTAALIPPHLAARARIVPKQSGILAGVQVAARVFQQLDPSIDFQPMLLDGDRVEGGESVALVSGSLATILTGERTALNFMQRMSGIATMTDSYVRAVAGTGAAIADTRKTAPGLRALDKYSVAVGGGRNHRFNLGDGVLIKDNHIAALQDEGFTLSQIIKRARASAPHTVKIEIEVESVDAAEAAIAAGADIVMLDNMSVQDMRVAAKLAKGRCLTEASGGVTLDNVREIAETGVDIVSIGALTHSVQALDISLDISDEVN
jgi:nicotinate-nucleotide pyrophosphorylase (carboxylating)